jgi:hypothetical protein
VEQSKLRSPLPASSARALCFNYPIAGLRRRVGLRTAKILDRWQDYFVLKVSTWLRRMFPTVPHWESLAVAVTKYTCRGEKHCTRDCDLRFVHMVGYWSVAIILILITRGSEAKRVFFCLDLWLRNRFGCRSRSLEKGVCLSFM